MKFSSNLEFLYYLNRSAGSSINYHQHSCFELVYYISGTGKTNINGEDLRYKQGTFAIIEPATQHDEWRDQETDVLFIGFKYYNIPGCLKNGIYSDTPQGGILRLLQQLKIEMLEKKAFYETKLEIILQELIVEILRAVSTNSDVKRGFSHIESFLQENYAQDINFHTLAELTGYSYHRFRHIFSDIYGISPYQYILRLRLENACRILTSSDCIIAKIALENGFSSESQFCSLFRRNHGCTPAEYRRMMGNK